MERHSHIERMRQSGQRRKDYCQEQGISLHVMGYWIRRLLEESAVDTGFKELRISSGNRSDEGSHVKILYLNGVKLRISQGSQCGIYTIISGCRSMIKLSSTMRYYFWRGVVVL